MSFESIRFPTVDLSLDKNVNIPIIRAACLDLGFFNVINSSINTADIERAREVARSFFAFPLNIKQEYPLTFSGGELFGYAAVGAEAADVANVTLTGQESPPDLMESYQVADPSTVINNFPLEGMKEALEGMYHKKAALALELLSLIAESLGLPSDYFHQHHFTKKHRSILRITRYPPLEECSVDRGAGISRISPHQDIGTITLLCQDQCGGLEVQDRCSKKWLPVIPDRDAMVVNIGNLMMRWTNYTYRSSVHRVISTAKSDHEERISVIFFVNPNDESIVEPIESTVTSCNPAHFEPFSVEEYLSCKFTQLFDPEARSEKGACRFDD
jgi:isopenicillin N synthase-like dioxygenase